MRALPATKADLSWLEDHVGLLARSATAIKAEYPSGKIAGMVGFDSWHPGSVQVHIALESPMAWRCLTRVVWDYAFNQEGVSSVLAVIPSHRCEAVRMAVFLGFRDTHRVRDGFAPGSDLIHFEMRRKDCRHLPAERMAA